SGACKGTCGNSGLCVYPATGTPCGSTPASCVDATHLAQQACDGKGSCVGQTSDCSPYQCVGNACPTSCLPATNVCAAGYSCSNMTCGKHLALGQTCSGKADCDSGYCA